MATAFQIDLGDMADRARRHLASGEYRSMDEMMQEALRALDREQAAFDDMLRAKVREADDDPSPDLPYDEAMAEVWREIDAERGG